MTQKEVDFETAFAALIDHFDEKNNYGQWSESDLRQFAEHFFKLGLKVQKGDSSESFNKDDFIRKVYEWLKGYAFVDDENKVYLPTLLHDFLKDSRTI